MTASSISPRASGSVMPLRSGRRVIAAGWARAREQFAAVLAERDALRQELVEVRRECNELRLRLADLCASVRRQWEAERETRRLQELHRTERAARDPAQRLQ